MAEHLTREMLERLRDDLRHPKPRPKVVSRREYDYWDLWFVERCSHEGKDVCSVCR